MTLLEHGGHFGFSLPKYNTLNQLYKIKNKCLGIISCKTNSSSEICAHLADYRYSVCRPFWISLPYI